MQRILLIITLLVAIGLGLYIARTEDDTPLSAADEGADRQRLFPDLRAEDLQAIRRDEGGKGVSLVRGADGRWLVRGERDHPAEPLLARAVAQAFAALSATHTLADPTDRSSYGLGTSAAHLVATRADGVQIGFLIGDQPPLAQGRYVQVDGQPAVHIVDAMTLLPLLRDPLEFRDRHLLGLTADELDRVELLTAEPDQPPSLDLRRDGRRWRFGEQGLRADSGDLRDLLAALEDLEATGSDVTPSSVEPPTRRLRLTTKQGATATITLWREVEPARCLARADGDALPAGFGGEILPVTCILSRLLDGDSGDFRALELLDINPWLVEHLTWKVGGTTWRIDKEDGHWVGPLPGGGRGRLDDDRVQQLLVQLDRLTAVSYADEDLGIRDAGTPLASIQGSHGDGEPFGLTLLRGSTRDHVAVDDEPLLREVSDEVYQLIGRLELPPALPESSE